MDEFSYKTRGIKKATTRSAAIGGEAMRRPSYSSVTNTCLLLGIASAFGFDRGGGWVWLVLGAAAGCVAVAVHFGRHWQSVASNSTQHGHLSVGYRNAYDTASGVRAPKATLGSHGAYSRVLLRDIVAFNRSAGAVYTLDVAYALGQRRARDPAEMALKMVKELQARERPTEVVIGGDGSITLKFKHETEEDAVSERLPVYLPEQSSGFVH